MEGERFKQEICKQQKMIEDYSFGKIRVNGKDYTFDVVIKKEKVSSWWRKSGHNVEISDVEHHINNAKVVVIGTGELGMMNVPEETLSFIKNKNIRFVVDKTESAIKTFNKEKPEDVVGLFHLTC